MQMRVTPALKVHLRVSYQGGVSVGYADLCQHLKKTNVVENAHV